MAEDKIEILGTWRVSFQNWRWDYTFVADGSVRWRDPLNNDSGVGKWSLAPANVIIAWADSSTKESWGRPIRQSGQPGWIDASYGVGALSAEKSAGPAGGLPGASGASDQIDLEIDPDTGEFVYTNPRSNSKYIDKIFTAVAFGLFPSGYYVFCEGMELPIHVPESMVDFELGSADAESNTIYDTFEKAKAAANDSAAARRVAYFWGAGGAVISPTIIGAGTTPELYSTIIAVRALFDQFMGIMVPWITMAIGMIGGPTPMRTSAGKSGTPRVAAKRGGNVPAKPKEPQGPLLLPEKGTRKPPTFDYRLAPHNDSGMGHLDYRHAPWSKAEKTSKFNQDTWNKLKSVVNETVQNGTIGTLKPDAAGKPQAGVVYENRFPNPTGLNAAGKPIYRVRVVVDANNHVTTCFPF
jgi:hypothetical protein